jgi:hypothetical protein
MDDRWFESRQDLGIFLFTTASRPALGPTQPPIQWVPGALSLWVRRPGREADQSPPPSAEVKNGWSYTSTPPIRLHGVVLSYSTGTTLALPYSLKQFVETIVIEYVKLCLCFHMACVGMESCRLQNWRGH